MTEHLYPLSSLFTIHCVLWAVLIFVFRNKVHTPLSETKGPGIPRGVGALTARPHNGEPLYPSYHPSLQAPLCQGSTSRVLSPLPCSPQERSNSLARRPPSLSRASLLLHREPENPERTSPARRRMLSSEQVQFASRKLQRYTGGGGGCGGTSGQPDSPTTTSGPSPSPRDPRPSSAPPGAPAFRSTN